MKTKLCTILSIALLGAGAMAQKSEVKKTAKMAASAVADQPINMAGKIRCSSASPSREWDVMFNKMVDQYKSDLAASRIAASNYVIPIVFHIIHSGQAEGTYPNLAQSLITSQVSILNADYAGTGYSTSSWSKAPFVSGGHNAFYDYAIANSLTGPDAAGIAIANTGISFCLATKDASGNTLAEPGIDRINCTTKGWTNPTALTSANFQTYIDGTIKPGSIWDPTRYFNVWLTDAGSSNQILGYSTFPSGTTLAGLSGGGSGNANATTDGCWVLASSVGSNSNAPYNLGRTLTHESGHYFGLRHVWGDGNCLDDYCADTPGAAAANYYGSGTGNTTYTYPYHKGTCTNTGMANPTDGELYMAFMDYSDDQFMMLFTNDQLTRMKAALTQSPDRTGLTAASATLCTAATVVKPVASFTWGPLSPSANSVTQLTDGSSNIPTSWAWTSSPTATITSSTSQNPTITFPAAGTYTVCVTATNSAGSSSTCNSIVVTKASTASVCDTITHIGKTDTLSLYIANSTTSSPDSGYIAGNNFYGDLQKAEFYHQTDFPAGSGQIKGAIILFFRSGTTVGTHGTSAMSLSMLSSAAGAPGASLASQSFTLTQVGATTAVQGVNYAGTPGLGYSTAIMVPYTVMFPSPVNLSSDFFLSVTLPTVAGDTAAIFMGVINKNTANTAWEFQSGSPNSWHAFSETPASWGFNGSLAILPLYCSIATSVENSVDLSSAVTIFPNPSAGQFTLSLNFEKQANATITVTNVLGQVILTDLEQNIVNHSMTMDLSKFGKGNYFVTVRSENGIVTKRIVIAE